MAALLLTPMNFRQVDGRGNVGALSWLWQPVPVPFYKAHAINSQKKKREGGKQTMTTKKADSIPLLHLSGSRRES